MNGKSFTQTLFFVAFTATLWLTATSKPQIDPKNLEGEIKAMLRNELKSLYLLRIQCPRGMFYSLTSEDCKGCEIHCPNGTNMEMCGEECNAYFKEKGVDESIQKQNEEIARLEDLIVIQQEENSELKANVSSIKIISILAIVLSVVAIPAAVSKILVDCSKSISTATTYRFVTNPAHDPYNTQYTGAAPNRRHTIICMQAASDESPHSPKNCENMPFNAQPTANNEQPRANNVQPTPNNVQPTPDTENEQPEDRQGLLNGQATSDSN